MVAVAASGRPAVFATRNRVLLVVAGASTILLAIANAVPYELNRETLSTVSVDEMTFTSSSVWFWLVQFVLPILACAATVAYAFPRSRPAAATALIAIGVGGYLLAIQDFGYLAATAGHEPPQRIGMTLSLLACGLLSLVGVLGSGIGRSRSSAAGARFAAPTVVLASLCMALGTVIPYEQISDRSYAVLYGPGLPPVADWYGVAPIGLAVLAVLLVTTASRVDRQVAGGLIATGTLAALTYAGYVQLAVRNLHGWPGAFIGLAGGLVIAIVGVALLFVPPLRGVGPEESRVVVGLDEIEVARDREAGWRRRALARDVFLLAIAVPAILLLAYERTTGELVYFVAIAVLVGGTLLTEYLARRRNPTDLVFPSRTAWEADAHGAALTSREALSIKTLVHPAERSRLALALLAALAAGALLFLVAIEAQSAGRAVPKLVGGLAGVLVLIWFTRQVMKARLLGRSIRVTAETLPALQALLDEVRVTLQYVRPVDVYVVDKGSAPIAMSSYLGTRIIVIEGNLVAGLDDPDKRLELKFLIGRSLGALKAKHARLDLVVVLLQTVNMLKFVTPLLLPWYRATTYSGDQIGVVCCADLRAALRATRQLLVGKELAAEVDEGTILPQAHLVQRRILPRLAQLFCVEPHNTNRYSNLLCFARYHDPELWNRLREAVDADQAQTLDQLWARSPYRRRAARIGRSKQRVPVASAV